MPTNFSRYRRLLLAAGALLLLGPARPAEAQDYYVYVAAESEDEVALVRFDGEAAAVVETIEVGAWPTEIEGPHGLNVSPDGRHWFLSIAHGMPYGRLLKYETGTNRLLGEVELGLFPATMEVSPATGLVYVVNFNLHGDMVPSTVSVVDPREMVELTRIKTGTMPHGSRLSPDGRWHYSLAMMSGELYEVDALTFEVRRTLGVGAPGGAGHGEHGGMHGGAAPPKPTWVDPHPHRPLAYVANNGTDEVVEVDLRAWRVTRRFATGAGPYNLEVTPDGRRLVVTYKTAGTTGIWDLETGRELARVPNSRRVPHGVTVSPDGRYAFVSVEGVGGEPGAVDVIDLQRLERVATAEVGKQAGGIAFWKSN